MRALIIAGSLLLPAFAQMPSGLKTAIDKTCLGCHSGTAAKGGLDFASLSFDLSNRVTRERWVRVHDRIEKGEMPPKGVELAAADRTAMLRQLAPLIHTADLADVAKNGRGPMRRLNRDEYEQDLRDILRLPYLDIRDMLPEDREAHHFNKVSETLDMSRVQLAAYLDASEAALRQAMATAPAPPAVTKFRTSGTNLFPGFRSTGTIHSMFFIKDNKGVNVEEERWTPLPKELAEDPSLEMGLFRSPGWPYGAFPRGFAARHAGEYRVRFSARAVLQHPGFQVSDAKHAVPMTFRSRRPTNHDIAEDVKSVGGILEIQPGANVYETTVPLIAGQTVEYGLLGLPVPQVDAEGKTGSYRYPPLPPGDSQGLRSSGSRSKGRFHRQCGHLRATGSFSTIWACLRRPRSPSEKPAACCGDFCSWRRAARRRWRQCGDSSNWCLPASTATSLSPKRCWLVIRPSCARICSCTCASRMTTSPLPTGFRTF